MKRFNGRDKLIASILALGIFVGVSSGCYRVENVNTDKSSISDIDPSSLYRQMYNITDASNEHAFALVKDVIYDYGKYMDADTLIKKAETLNIHYEYLDEDISGYYKKSTNEIVINTRFRDDKDAVLFHEMMHFLSQSGFQQAVESGSKTLYFADGENDGLSQEFTNEYYYREYERYTKEVALNNALMEIIDIEDMAKPYFRHNLNNLLNKMERYTSRRDAETLIHCIDGVSTYSSRYKNSGSKSDYNNYKECANLAWVIIENIYNKKYGNDIDNDPVMMAYKTIILDDNYTSEKDVTKVVVDKDYLIKDNDPKIIYYTKGRIVDGKYTNNKVVKIKKRAS